MKRIKDTDKDTVESAKRTKIQDEVLVIVKQGGKHFVANISLHQRTDGVISQTAIDINLEKVFTCYFKEGKIEKLSDLTPDTNEKTAFGQIFIKQTKVGKREKNNETKGICYLFSLANGEQLALLKKANNKTSLLKKDNKTLDNKTESLSDDFICHRVIQEESSNYYSTLAGPIVAEIEYKPNPFASMHENKKIPHLNVFIASKLKRQNNVCQFVFLQKDMFATLSDLGLIVFFDDVASKRTFLLEKDNQLILKAECPETFQKCTIVHYYEEMNENQVEISSDTIFQGVAADFSTATEMINLDGFQANCSALTFSDLCSVYNRVGTREKIYDYSDFWKRSYLHYNQTITLLNLKKVEDESERDLLGYTSYFYIGELIMSGSGKEIANINKSLLDKLPIKYLKRRKVFHLKEITDSFDFMNTIYDNYIQHFNINSNESKYLPKKIIELFDKTKKGIATAKKWKEPIVLTMLGECFSGKSYIISHLALDNEDIDEKLKSQFLLHNIETYSITKIPTFVAFNKEEKDCTISIKKCSVSEEGTIQEGELLFITNKDTPLCESLESVNKYLTNYQSDNVDGLYISGPFKYLRENKIIILDTCGLNENDSVIQKSVQMSKASKVFIYLHKTSSKRNIIPFNAAFNKIEPFLVNRQSPPYFTVCRRIDQETKVNAFQLERLMINHLHAHDDSKDTVELLPNCDPYFTEMFFQNAKLLRWFDFSNCNTHLLYSMEEIIRTMISEDLYKSIYADILHIVYSIKRETRIPDGERKIRMDIAERKAAAKLFQKWLKNPNLFEQFVDNILAISTQITFNSYSNIVGKLISEEKFTEILKFWFTYWKDIIIEQLSTKLNVDVGEIGTGNVQSSQITNYNQIVDILIEKGTEKRTENENFVDYVIQELDDEITELLKNTETVKKLYAQLAEFAKSSIFHCQREVIVSLMQSFVKNKDKIQNYLFSSLTQRVENCYDRTPPKEATQLGNKCTEFFNKQKKIGSFTSTIQHQVHLPPRYEYFEPENIAGTANPLNSIEKRLATSQECNWDVEKCSLMIIKETMVTDLKEIHIVQIDGGFKIIFYENWELDLKLEENSKLFPLFVPSKKRANNYLSAVKEQLEKRTSLYICVESSELEEYRKFKMFPDQIFVSIPGNNRGPAFAYSMILMLQKAMREELKKNEILFDYFWIIADDIEYARVFSVCSWEPTSMNPCNLDIALYESQKAFLELQGKFDNRLKIDEKSKKVVLVKQIYSSYVKVVVFLLQLEVKTFPSHTEIIKILDHSNPDNFLQKLCENISSTIIVDEEVKNAIRKMFEEKQIGSSLTYWIGEANYNHHTPFGKHFRVSSLAQGCVLHYAPACEGYNYLPIDHTLLEQDTINSLIKNITKTASSKKRNSKDIVKSNEYKFNGSGKVLANRLELDGKFSILMYFFDIKYGSNADDGGMKYIRNLKKSKEIKNAKSHSSNRFNSNKVDETLSGLNPLPPTSFGLELINVEQDPGQNNCLFNSFIATLKLTNVNGSQLRDQVCKYMEEHRMELRDKILIQFTEFKDILGINKTDDEKVQSYINHMQKDSTYGGELEILILSKMYNCDIIVRDKQNGIRLNFPFVLENKSNLPVAAIDTYVLFFDKTIEHYYGSKRIEKCVWEGDGEPTD